MELRQKPDLHGMRILLVDDSPLNREVACAMLRAAGAEVVSVESGEAAVSCFAEAGEESWSAILMDLHMPGLSGQEAAREIRALPRPDATSVPIFAMSAQVDGDKQEIMQEAGMTDWIEKPFSMQQMYDQMAKLKTNE